MSASAYAFVPGQGYQLPSYPFRTPPELRGKTPGVAPVVIVGAGLTGLTLACALAQLGVPAVLIDEDYSVGVRGASSRGICYTQKSLEIFDRLGIYPRIAERGVQWRVGRTYAGHDEVYSFDLGAQAEFSLSAQPPFMNIQQFYIEGFLVERLQALGCVDLRWGTRLTGFAQNEEHATLTVDTPEGSYQLQAHWVVDATGSGSPLRRWLNIPVKAKRGDDRWCIADVRFRTEPPRERHTWIEAPFNDNRAVWQHLMADGVWRIDYQMAPDCDPAEVSREDVVMERLRRHFGADADVELVWVGPYAYRSECVERMREGRVFFAGDSAKVVSPFGARGGNTGISDADNLAWKLAAVVQGRAHAALLQTYHEERHEAATENVRVTNRTARFLRPADGEERRFRQAAIDLARRQPFARSLINTGRMAVANRYSRSSACASTGGHSVQNVGLHVGAGRGGRTSPATGPEHMTTLNQVLLWAQGRPLLVWFGALSVSTAAQLRALSETGTVRCVQVVDKPSLARAVEHLVDPAQQLLRACQPNTTTSPPWVWALIRPDAYLADGGAAWSAQALRAVAANLGLETIA
jgi:3-(3-hydroxy-phenyl)propionate hydroxylase